VLYASFYVFYFSGGTNSLHVTLYSWWGWSCLLSIFGHLSHAHFNTPYLFSRVDMIWSQISIVVMYIFSYLSRICRGGGLFGCLVVCFGGGLLFIFVIKMSAFSMIFHYIALSHDWLKINTMYLSYIH
jgi:hypothetical protein